MVEVFCFLSFQLAHSCCLSFRVFIMACGFLAYQNGALICQAVNICLQKVLCSRQSSPPFYMITSYKMEGRIKSGPADYMPPYRRYLLFTVTIDMGTVRVIIKFPTDTHTHKYKAFKNTKTGVQQIQVRAWQERVQIVPRLRWLSQECWRIPANDTFLPNR